MALKTEGRPLGMCDALQRAVEQRAMRGAQGVRQSALVHRETVVLAGDQHVFGIQLLHRMIGTVMTKLHLQGLGAGRQSQ
jgi:hypothetical protein